MKGFFVVAIVLNWVFPAVIGGYIASALWWSVGGGVFLGLLVGTWFNLVLAGFMYGLIQVYDDTEKLKRRSGRSHDKPLSHNNKPLQVNDDVDVPVFRANID